MSILSKINLNLFPVYQGCKNKEECTCGKEQCKRCKALANINKGIHSLSDIKSCDNHRETSNTNILCNFCKRKEAELCYRCKKGKADNIFVGVYEVCSNQCANLLIQGWDDVKNGEPVRCRGFLEKINSLENINLADSKYNLINKYSRQNMMIINSCIMGKSLEILADFGILSFYSEVKREKIIINKNIELMRRKELRIQRDRLAKTKKEQEELKEEEKLISAEKNGKLEQYLNNKKSEDFIRKESEEKCSCRCDFCKAEEDSRKKIEGRCSCKMEKCDFCIDKRKCSTHKCLCCRLQDDKKEREEESWINSDVSYEKCPLFSEKITSKWAIVGDKIKTRIDYKDVYISVHTLNNVLTFSNDLFSEVLYDNKNPCKELSTKVVKVLYNSLLLFNEFNYRSNFMYNLRDNLRKHSCTLYKEEIIIEEKQDKNSIAEMDDSKLYQLRPKIYSSLYESSY